MLRSLLVAATLVSHCLVHAAKGSSSAVADSRRAMRTDWRNSAVHRAYMIHADDEDYMKANQATLAARAGVLGTRQECRTLDEDTRRRTFDCIGQTFTAPTPSGLDAMYSMFEKWHRRSMSPGAHDGCCFLPWHRLFIARFEQACRDVCGDPGFNLCYWDVTLDSEMPSPCQSAMFSESLFGNSTGKVTAGFAANKQCLGDCEENFGPVLSRDCGGGRGWPLSSTADADAFVDCPDFRTLVTPFSSSYAEGFHGPNHMFVGGHMSVITCAPCDPIFYAYHCWLDYLWSRQQDRQSRFSDPGQGYPVDEDVPPDHRADDPMTPFERRCGEGIGYPSPFTPYAPSPRACRGHGDCGGRALWCNGGRCMGSVGPGGTMDPGWPDEACYIQSCENPVTRDGICECGD